MKIFVESILPCTANLAWSEVQRSGLLQEVTFPIVTVRPMGGETLPETWSSGPTVRCRCFLLGLIPLGTRTLVLERIDHERREIQSRESDPLVRRWDHLVRIRPAGDKACWYSDEIEIDAGWRTSLVARFALFFYRHRQRRWRKVARRLASA